VVESWIVAPKTRVQFSAPTSHRTPVHHTGNIFAFYILIFLQFNIPYFTFNISLYLNLRHPQTSNLRFKPKSTRHHSNFVTIFQLTAQVFWLHSDITKLSFTLFLNLKTLYMQHYGFASPLDVMP
jgi:hypothetical protein